MTFSAFDPAQRLNQGIALLQQGDLNGAWQAFSEVVHADRGNALAWHLRGVVFLQAGQFKEAAGELRQSIALNPRDPIAHSNLAGVLREIGEYDEALTEAEAAIRLDVGSFDGHLNRGNALLDLARPDEALHSYARAIKINPNDPRPHSNGGNACRSLGRLAEAVKAYDRALAIDPNNPDIRATSAFAWLGRGDLPRGFELFESRWGNPNMAAYLQSRRFTAPFWRGEAPIEGKTLLLHSEQGFGDVLQFCRYATLAAVWGARVIVEADPALAPLLRSLRGVDQVVAHGQPLPSYDLHCPMMSLPFAFKTTLRTIPSEVPYLHADPAKVEAWRGLLGPKVRPQVGIAWSSGVRPDQPELKAINGRRNMPLQKLKALAGLDVDFVSLQKGEPAESEFGGFDQSAWTGLKIRNVASLLTDFSETAALMTALDLVISVDTSIPHLAGALGRPVWVMNRFDPCWRWLQDRTDSPWYPTARLFRQPRMGDWDSVLAEVARFLGEFRPEPS
jgi:Tfp pilus assembly protein PilF